MSAHVESVSSGQFLILIFISINLFYIVFSMISWASVASF